MFLARLNRAIFWFHPLAWWMERRLAILAEQSADEASVQTAGGRERYASLLLEMAAAVEQAGKRVAWQAVAMARPSHIRQRVEHILSPRAAASRRMTSAAAALLLLVGVPLVYAVDAVRLQARPAPIAKAPLAAAPILLAPQAAAAPQAPKREKPDFSGTWKLAGGDGISIFTFQHDDGKLRVIQRIEDGLGKRTLDVKGAIDGKPHRQMVDGRPCVFTASWLGEALIWETERVTGFDAPNQLFHHRRIMTLRSQGNAIEAEFTRILPEPKETATEIWEKVN